MRVLAFSHSMTDGELAQSSRLWWLVSIVLTLSILVSAFSIVYFKDLNRRVFIDYQSQQQQHQYDRVQWGKLMLEESAWSTQAKIQTVATCNLPTKIQLLWCVYSPTKFK